MSGAPSRDVLLITHTGRPQAQRSAAFVIDRLLAAGVGVRLLRSEADDLRADHADCVAGTRVMEDPDAAAEGCELVVTLGGDGTLLRGAQLARPSGTPILGINLGHVGFLAEAEFQALSDTVDHVVHRRYDVEERMTIDVSVHADGDCLHTDWALNEASIEKASRERMIEVVVEIDGRPLSRWGCDGVICATPTGSTAYAFSAGGPIVWPEVDALLMVPLSAHALFARPMVASPSSVLAVEVIAGTQGRAVLWCDGRRRADLPPGARIEVRRGSEPVRLARLYPAPFTDRLVAKFQLPVQGWRGGSAGADPAAAPDA